MTYTFSHSSWFVWYSYYPMWNLEVNLTGSINLQRVMVLQLKIFFWKIISRQHAWEKTPSKKPIVDSILLQPRTKGGPCQLQKSCRCKILSKHLTFYTYLRVRFYGVQGVFGQYRSIVVDAFYGHVHCRSGSTWVIPPATRGDVKYVQGRRAVIVDCTPCQAWKQRNCEHVD